MKNYFFLILFITIVNTLGFSQQTQKPPLHGKNWMAITGKPMAATAGASIFQKGGNAVDAACAMIAATCTMWDVLSWGGEIFTAENKSSRVTQKFFSYITGCHPEPVEGRSVKHLEKQ